MIAVARLKIANTGVVVEVSDDKVDRLPLSRQPVASPEAEPTTRARRVKK